MNYHIDQIIPDADHLDLSYKAYLDRTPVGLTFEPQFFTTCSNHTQVFSSSRPMINVTPPSPIQSFNWKKDAEKAYAT